MQTRDLTGGDVLFIGRSLFVLVNPEVEFSMSNDKDFVRRLGLGNSLSLQLVKLGIYYDQTVPTEMIGLQAMSLPTSVVDQNPERTTVHLEDISEKKLVNRAYLLQLQSVPLDQQAWFLAGRVGDESSIGFDGTVRVPSIRLQAFENWKLVRKPFGRRSL